MLLALAEVAALARVPHPRAAAAPRLQAAWVAVQQECQALATHGASVAAWVVPRAHTRRRTISPTSPTSPSGALAVASARSLRL